MVINGVSTAINSIELPQATRSDYITRRYQKVLAAWMISTFSREEKESKKLFLLPYKLMKLEGGAEDVADGRTDRCKVRNIHVGPA